MRTYKDLLVLNSITILLVVVALLPSISFQIIPGLIVLLFIPGYILIVALFPGKSQLDGIERASISFFLSLIIIALIGFALNFTPWGIRPHPVLIVVAIIIALLSLIAWYRRSRLDDAKRFVVSFNLPSIPWRGKTLVDKALISILALALLGTTGIISYAAIVPRVGEQFTEFYILGSDGKAEGYPEVLFLGRETALTAVIVNHEHETVSYRIEVLIDGLKNSESGPIILDHEENREILIGFQPTAAGNNQKVEFLLYRQGQSEAYRSLYILINVKQAGS